MKKIIKFIKKRGIALSVASIIGLFLGWILDEILSYLSNHFGFSIPIILDWITENKLITVALLLLILVGFYIFDQEKDESNSSIKQTSPPLLSLHTDVKPYVVKEASKYYDNNDDKDYEHFVMGTATPYYYKDSMRGVFGSTEGVEINSELTYFGLINITNNKNSYPNVEEARNVWGGIIFFNEDVEQLNEEPITARWSNIPEPSVFITKPKPDYEFEQINLPANGKTFTLCLLVKRNRDEYCMRYSIQNYKSQFNEKEFYLYGKLLYAKLSLQGENLPLAEFWFKIFDFDDGSGFKLEKLTVPVIQSK